MAATRPAFVSVICFLPISCSARMTTLFYFFKRLSGTCDLMLTSTTFSMVHVLGGSKNIFGAIEMDVFLGKCRKNGRWRLDGSFLFQFWFVTFFLWEFTPKIITFHLKNKQTTFYVLMFCKQNNFCNTIVFFFSEHFFYDFNQISVISVWNKLL